MLILPFLSGAFAGSLQETDNYTNLTETCEKSFDVTFDEASFEGSELGVQMGLGWCASALDGVRTTCTDEGKRTDMHHIEAIRCMHDDEPTDRVATRLEGTTLIIGINRKTGNLKSDVYEWTMRMPVPKGALSAEDRAEKEEGAAMIAKNMARSQRYCRNEVLMTVEIDWESFAPILEKAEDRQKYGYSGIYGGCAGVASVVGSICNDRFKPPPEQLSPSDAIKGFRCVYAAGADVPVMSMDGGIVTAGFDANTANVVSTSADFVREKVPLP